MLAIGALFIALLAFLFAFLLTRTGYHTPSNIYIPLDTYMCSPNDGFSVCSGNGYDEYGNQWTVIDKAYYQERNPDDTRRILNMTLTNGNDIYLLEGSGRGDNNPSPSVDVAFTFAVTNHPGLNAHINVREINCENVYVVSFYRQ